MDKDKEILYIGKTSSIRERLSQHFNKNEFKVNEWKSRVYFIKLFYFINPVDMSIYEIYWINKYKPKYNISDKYANYSPSMILEENIMNSIFSINDLSYTYINNYNVNLQESIDLIKDKQIILYEDDHPHMENHNYKFMYENQDKMKNYIYNLLKNKFKTKSKESCVTYSHPEIINFIRPRSYVKSINNFEEGVTTLIFVGYINFKSENKNFEMNYNLFNLINKIKMIKNQKINLAITSYDLQQEFKKIIQKNKCN